MPNFIKDAPWYMKDSKKVDTGELGEGPNEGHDGQADDQVLFHQRIDGKKGQKQSFDNWYKRGVKKTDGSAKQAAGSQGVAGSFAATLRGRIS